MNKPVQRRAIRLIGDPDFPPLAAFLPARRAVVAIKLSKNKEQKMHKLTVQNIQKWLVLKYKKTQLWKAHTLVIIDYHNRHNLPHYHRHKILLAARESRTINTKEAQRAHFAMSSLCTESNSLHLER
nr:unnamed protein product [Callosobruchus chinensis]